MTHDILGELRDLYVSDDVEARIEEKRVAAAEIIDCLEVTLRSHRFGAFIHALCVDQDAIEDRISRVPSSVRISQAVGALGADVTSRPASPQRPSAVSRPARPNRPDAPGKAQAVEAPGTDARTVRRDPIQTMTSEAFQANTAIDIWIEHMMQLRANPERLAAFHFTADAAADLMRELVHGFQRTAVAEDMKSLLKSIDYGMTVDKQAPPASIVCAETINSFVFDLGAGKLPASERPVIKLSDGTSRVAFEERDGSDTAFDLPEVQRAVTEDYWTDWVYMLEALLIGNAKDGETGAINTEQNIAMGRIVDALARDTTG
jgi:hypothetical protein